MNYATPADMLNRFGEQELLQLTDRDGAGMVNASALQRALDDATVYADGYLGRVYRLPLLGCAKPLTSPGGTVEYVTPPSLTRLVCDLARYYLFTDVVQDHEAVRRYKAALFDLKAITDGTQQLACPWGGPAGEALHTDGLESDQAYYNFTPRALNDDSLRGFA